MTIRKYVELDPSLGRSLKSTGLLIWFIGFFIYVIGPTIIDPHGDGLWYGAASLIAGLLIGYDIAH